jgi:hypothetical protein
MVPPILQICCQQSTLEHDVFTTAIAIRLQTCCGEPTDFAAYACDSDASAKVPVRVARSFPLAIMLTEGSTDGQPLALLPEACDPSS